MKCIRIKKETGNNVVTRRSVQLLFASIEKLKECEIILDFEEVDFISRSGADEYLKLRDACKKRISEINQSREVKAMLQIVSSGDNMKPEWEAVDTVCLQ